MIVTSWLLECHKDQNLPFFTFSKFLHGFTQDCSLCTDIICSLHRMAWR